MRNPNGYGSVRKLSGKRRRPFQVLITTGWKITDGKLKQIQTPLGYYKTRPEAMIALAEYNQNPFDLDVQKITFADIYEKIYARNISKMGKSSIASYRAAYIRCEPLHHLKMVDMRKQHMQAIFDSISDMSRPYQQAIKNLLRAIYKYCLENDIVQKDYSQFVEITASDKESKRKPFTPEEIQILRNNLDFIVSPGKDGMLSRPWVDSILIMIYTGVRISELLGIKLEHVNLKERYIDLHGTKTKAARRIVPIHKDILPLIEKRMVFNDTEWLFYGNDNKKISYSTFKYAAFDAIMEHFDMSHNPHDCRHSFATYARQSHMDLLLIKRIMGHTSKDITTDIYTHTIVADLVAEIDKFNC